MRSACDWHHCDAWWKIFSTCPACHATADTWYSAVDFMSSGLNVFPPQPLPTTPLTGFNNDGSKSSLKQIWRPWDWRMPADIQYARSFLEHPARISSMMHGKVLTAEGSNAVSYVSMFPWNSGSCKCCGLVSNISCATMMSVFLERGI